MEVESINSFTITIPEYNFDWLQEHIDKLNKKAIKLNCEPISLKVINEKLTKHNKELIVELDIEIKGSAPKLSEWTFIGKLEQVTRDNNLISSVPGYEIPLSYRTTPITCEHCGINRARKYTYLVQHEITKEIKQIGHSCLRDFLGHPNPEMYALWAESLMNLKEELSGQMPLGNSVDYHDIKEYLSYVVQEIKKSGWTSRTNTQYGGISTADSAWKELVFREYEPEQESYKLADTVLNWIRTTEVNEENQYMYNLKLLCSKEYVKYKYVGIVASLIVTYQKAMEIEIKRKIREEQNSHIVNEFLGNIKDKITQPVTVIFKRFCDSQYPSTLYKFITDDGYCLTWFASGINDQLEQGIRQ